MYTISFLRAFTDNYIWLIQYKQNLIVIDPGDAKPVIEYIKVTKLKLHSIILTHSHADHIGGVNELIALYQPQVIDNFNNQLVDEQKLSLLAELPEFKVITTPGHTYDGVCYLFDNKHLFCGDTLFAAGCGRVFTGDYLAMLNSLNKIKNLSLDTKIYPGHEYTLNNLNFAKLLEPNNFQINLRIKQEQDKLTLNGTTLPTNLELELATNPFFRTNEPTLISALKQFTKQQIFADELAIFVTVRLLRNNF